MKRMLSKKKIQGIVLVLPVIIYFLIFAVYPMISNFILTFQTQNYLGKTVYAGLSNYIYVFEMPHISQIFDNTLIYTFAVPFIDIFLAIPLSIVLKKLNKSYLLPVILLSSFVPLVTGAVMWVFMLNPFYGFIYYIDKVDLFTTAWSIVIIDIWSSLPLATLIIYSALKSIPPYIDEASQMDGLTGLKRLIQVDLPYIKNSILSAFILMLIFGTFTFDPIYISQTVSPPFATLDLAFFSYTLFFSGETGEAAVIMTFMTITSTLIGVIAVRFTLYKTSRIKKLRFKFLSGKELPKPVAWLILSLFMTFFLLPFVWLIFESFKTSTEIIAIPPMVVPSIFSFSSYFYSLTVGQPYFIVSILVSGLASVLVFLIGAPAAYSMARHGTGGLKIIAFVLFIYSLPTVVFMIPIHDMVQSIGLINNWVGLVITYPVFVMPIAIWMLYNFYLGFPKHIDEAANMDGMNVYSSFYKVVLKLSGDGIYVSLLYAFIIAWGALIFPLALTYSSFNLNFLFPSGAQTVTIFIGGTIGHEAFNYGVLSAASVISLIPSLILVIISRKRIDKLWRVGGNVG